MVSIRGFWILKFLSYDNNTYQQFAGNRGVRVREGGNEQSRSELPHEPSNVACNGNVVYLSAVARKYLAHTLPPGTPLLFDNGFIRYLAIDTDVAADGLLFAGSANIVLKLSRYDDHDYIIDILNSENLSHVIDERFVVSI